MWEATVWALGTWVKVTALLAVLLGICWLWLGSGSGGFVLAVLAAVLIEIHLTRALLRELGTEAGMHWWWTR
jgi:hypothetical protein